MSSVAQSKPGEQYYKYIDSADNRIDNYPKLANTFLDSIPQPLNNSINARLADYYHLKAVVSSYLSQQAEVYHYNILALKYAEKEKNYNIAGTSSLELFYNLFLVNKDSTAYSYLKKAKTFYKLDHNKEGLTEVMQMAAFAEFYRHNYKKSNALILSKLDRYRAIEKDQYYYMYALFMLTSNYIHLEDDVNYRKYFNVFKTLESNATIPPLLYKGHEVTLYNCIAEMYLEVKQWDSVLPYLEKSSQMRDFMNDFDIENYFGNQIAYYDALNDLSQNKNYVDSLKIFQQGLLKKTVDASFNINETLLETNLDLETTTKKKDANRNWIIALALFIVVLIVFVLFRYKSLKKVLDEFSKRKKEYALLHTNHEKLKVKVKGLEGYMSEVKKEVKTIASISDKLDQQLQVKELYKNIQNNSSTLLSKSEDHLELISELNIEFFNDISIKHPNLNSSEIIVCYYLFMGFKSKEIAVFLNTSTRAIESKRYRVSNKINVKEQGVNLTDYLTSTFSVISK